MTSSNELVTRVAERFFVAGWRVEVAKPMEGMQLDIYATQDGQAPLVAECKAYRRLVGLRTAREFASVVEFLREGTSQLQAWLVTTSGFTPNAAEALQRNRIEAFTISDVEQRLQPKDPHVLYQGPVWKTELEDARKKKKRVFVIMPFSDEMLDVFMLGIRWAASQLGAVAERADDLEHNGEIIEEIRAAIRSYDVIVGDTSGANPNVCYEIGYAHALQKPTILICRNGEELPFDLQGVNHFFYPNVLGLREPLRQKLESALGQGVRSDVDSDT